MEGYTKISTTLSSPPPFKEPLVTIAAGGKISSYTAAITKLLKTHNSISIYSKASGINKSVSIAEKCKRSLPGSALKIEVFELVQEVTWKSCSELVDDLVKKTFVPAILITLTIDLAGDYVIE
jgi:hypothetical protein